MVQHVVAIGDIWNQFQAVFTRIKELSNVALIVKTALGFNRKGNQGGQCEIGKDANQVHRVR